MSRNRSDEEEKVGGDGEDGLEHAAQQISKTSDSSLASLFVEANQQAQDSGIAQEQELFEDGGEEYEFREHVPDPRLVESIYDSLSQKEIHHKKLLEEGVSPNFFVNLFNRIRNFLSLKSSGEGSIPLAPPQWKVYSLFHRAWRRNTAAYLGDFCSQMDLYLRDRSKTLRILRTEFLSLFLILASSVALMVFSSRNITVYGGLYSSWSSVIFSLSLISLVLSAVPPFLFFSLWFSNVNHLHTSRNFHFFLFATITLALMFASVAAFNMGLFHLFRWRFG